MMVKHMKGRIKPANKPADTEKPPQQPNKIVPKAVVK
jgi:hypothetical protein